MSKSTKPSRVPLTSFKGLQKVYGLTTPEQIKLRIIWQHLQALTLEVHGKTPENISKMKSFDHAFRIAEQEESLRLHRK